MAKKQFNTPKKSSGIALDYGKVPPQALDLEEAVLGAMTLSGSRPKVPEQIIERIG